MKHSLRYLWRNKTATAINVSGLAIALSAAFLMLQYLDFELSYDKYLPEHPQVYRIATEQKESGVVNRSTAEAYYAIADWITGNFEEVESATRVNRWPANTGFDFEVDGKHFQEKRYLIADKGFFKVFPSLLISGNPETCLDGPNVIVVSDRLAIKAFGTTDIVGRTITNPNWRGHNFLINGVFKQTPSNSHIDADIIHAHEWVPDAKDQWVVTIWTYIRVKKDTDVAKLQEKLNAAVAPMMPNQKVTAKLTLQPLASIHLMSNLSDEVKAPGNIVNIYIVFGALILITLMAWINYVILETARFLKRLKEVGIRRIIGSSKLDLFWKFFAEYVTLLAIAVALSVAITVVVFPYFGDITGLQLSRAQFTVRELWVGASIGLLVIAAFAGTYPLISILRINTVSSLKGKVTEAFHSFIFRRGLVAFQLVASLTLMALVVMASLQLNFMQSAKMNFSNSGILTVYNSANYTYLEDSLRQPKNDFFRNKLLQIPSVTNLTTSSAVPGEPIGFTYTDLAKRSMSDPDRQIHYKVMYIDYDFIPLFGLEVLAGRNYSPQFSDEWCILVTESTVRELGFSSTEESIGQKIYFNEPDDWNQWTIIGVVKDYRHESIKTPINPGIFRLHRNEGQMLYYSMSIKDVDILPSIEKLWRETWPGKPFEYFFLDEHYDQQYKSEIHFSRVFTTFSGVAILIACLGIMGMSLFEANARTKEIGIRKVLGAQLTNILFLLTRDSVRTLLLSFLIAMPVVYLLSTEWLSKYPEHITFSLWFVIAPLALIALLVLIVSLTQVLKAAMRNPVEALKNE